MPVTDALQRRREKTAPLLPRVAEMKPLIYFDDAVSATGRQSPTSSPIIGSLSSAVSHPHTNNA